MSTFFHRHQRTIIWVVILAFAIGAGGLLTLNRSGLLGSGDSSSTADVPNYAAKVRGRTVTSEALAQLSSNLYSYYRDLAQNSGTTFPQGARGALSQLQITHEALVILIEQALIADEAESRGIKITAGEIDAAAEALYSSRLQQFGVTEQQLKDYLVANNSSLDEYKKSIRTEAELQLKRDAVEDLVVQVDEPDDDDLLAYYEANISSYDIEEEVLASHILVSDEDLAIDLRERIAAGEDFAELAAEYSEDGGSAAQGGDLGWFGRGRMVSQFEEEAFALGVGEIGDPIRSPFGWHIVWVRDRVEAGTPSFSEVKETVRADYMADEAARLLAEWYETQRRKDDVIIGIPILNAYDLQERDSELGFAEYERLYNQGSTSDDYIPYYMGRIREAQALAAFAERTELEAIEEPTQDQIDQIEALLDEQTALEQEAISHYLLALDRVEADEEFLNRILRLSPDSVTAKYLLGKLRAERGDYEGAEAQFAAVIETDAEYVQAYSASADAAIEQGDYAFAKERLLAAQSIKPQDVFIRIRLIEAHLALDEVDEAEALLAGLLEEQPGSVHVMMAEGDVAAGRLAQLIDERDELAASDPERAEALQGQIDAAEQAAVDRYKEAMSIAGTLELNIKLGHVYRLVGRLSDAESEFRFVIQRSPSNADAHEGMAETLADLGDIEGAIDSYESVYRLSFDSEQRMRAGVRLTELVPDDGFYKLQLAQLYADMGEWSDAIRAYARAIDDDPELNEAYRGIAEAYRQRGDFETAFEYLERGLGRAGTNQARALLLELILEYARAEAGSEGLLSERGQTALYELALNKWENEAYADALPFLEELQSEYPDFRVEDVRALLTQVQIALGIEPTASDDDPTPEDGSEDETDSESDGS